MVFLDLFGELFWCVVLLIYSLCCVIIRVCDVFPNGGVCGVCDVDLWCRERKGRIPFA